MDKPQPQYTVTKQHNKHTKKIIIIAGIILFIIIILTMSQIFANVNADNQSQNIDIAKIPDKKQDKLDIVNAQENQNRTQADKQQANTAAANNQSYQAPLYLEAASSTISSSPSMPIQQNTIPIASYTTSYTIETNEIDDNLKNSILKQTQAILNTQASGYSSIKYKDYIHASSTNINQTKIPDIPVLSNKKIIFKAGDILYASLINGINTDDGTNNILAILYGSEYDGSILIGQINQHNDNISLKFNQLSPKDRTKKAFTINAIAIRQEDARQGIAEKIDNHTLKRYTYLFASSILKAIGSAAQSNTETIIAPGGTIIQNQHNDTDSKTIAKRSAGEIGSVMGNELSKNFNRPPTYTVPANQGIGVIFMEDVEQ